MISTRFDLSDKVKAKPVPGKTGQKGLDSMKNWEKSSRRRQGLPGGKGR
jgi:hypothetical protein